jgi:hypothetical protein
LIIGMGLGAGPFPDFFLFSSSTKSYFLLISNKSDYKILQILSVPGLIDFVLDVTSPV